MIEKQDRQAWLATLAHAPRDLLGSLFDGHVDAPTQQRCDWLRVPEVGLTMVRARVGGGGDRFNLGETTLTRCVVRHRADDGSVVAGVGYVKGRDPERARWVATLDALLQRTDSHQRLMRDVLDPLARAVDAARRARAAATATSRVRFFTLEPGIA